MESNAAELPISHKAWVWLEKNRKQATWGAVIVTAVGLATWLFVWQRAEKEARASRALSDVNSAAAGFAGPAQESPEAYLKVVAEHPKSAAAPRALLAAAGAYFHQGKFSEAEAQFTRFTREYRESPLLGQALLGVAACLDAQGKTEQAVTAYKELISRHPSDSVIPQAKYSLARLYEAQNKPEQARDLYEQLHRDNRFTSLGDDVAMRLEELLEKYPHLAPPAAPAPTPISLTPIPAAGLGTGALSQVLSTNAAPATNSAAPNK